MSKLHVSSHPYNLASCAQFPWAKEFLSRQLRYLTSQLVHSTNMTRTTGLPKNGPDTQKTNGHGQRCQESSFRFLAILTEAKPFVAP